MATGALDYYTNWTGIELPLSKFDYVAVPGKSGAMENWGLLQFDERRLLVDPVCILQLVIRPLSTVLADPSWARPMRHHHAANSHAHKTM